MNTNSNNGFLWAVVVVLAFGLGFLSGRMTSGSALPFSGGNSSTTGANDASGSSENGTKVNASRLTAGQIKLLAAFGIDPNSVTITPTMIACAEASLGSARVEEIKNGATPSVTEGVKLAACYK